MAYSIKIFIYFILVLYVSASICYLAGSKNTFANRMALWLAVGGFLSNLVLLVVFTYTGKRLPLATGNEFLLSFICITALVYLIFEMITKTNNAGGVVMLIEVLLLLVFIILMPDQMEKASPLLPALKSHWLTIHVLTAVLSYSGFTLAAGLAFGQLRTTNSNGEAFIYRIVTVSFALLSLSIVLGAIWAEQAWGSYWSWDPKEIWALITWIVYAVYLHLRKQREWRGKPAIIMVLVGFSIVLFTFLGVNYIMPGLHSYAGLNELETILII